MKYLSSGKLGTQQRYAGATILSQISSDNIRQLHFHVFIYAKMSVLRDFKQVTSLRKEKFKLIPFSDIFANQLA